MNDPTREPVMILFEVDAAYAPHVTEYLGSSVLQNVTMLSTMERRKVLTTLGVEIEANSVDYEQVDPDIITWLPDDKSGDVVAVATVPNFQEFAAKQNIPIHVATRMGQIILMHNAKKYSYAPKQYVAQLPDMSDYVHVTDGRADSLIVDKIETLTSQLQSEKLVIPNIGDKSIEFLRRFCHDGLHLPA